MNDLSRAQSRDHVAMKTWDALGASSGIWAAVSLGAGYAIVRTTSAQLTAPDAEFVRAMLAERIKWEWITFVRLLGGALVLWFSGSLASRLRRAEGEPARLTTAALGLGILWSGVWLLSAFFNSASIMLAAEYGDPAGARVAAVLAREAPYVLTAAIMFALLLATSFVALRFGGFPKPYAYVTAALTGAFIVLALVDWYGGRELSGAIVGLALLWMGATSLLPRPLGMPPSASEDRVDA
jgi:hypothetical protein